MAHSGLKVDDILAKIHEANTKTASQKFVESLQSKEVKTAQLADPVEETIVVEETPVIEETPAPVEEAPVTEETTPVEEAPVEEAPVEETPAEATVVEETAEVVETDEEKTAELKKIAEDYDARGRIMARAFYDEIQKLAAAEPAEVEEVQVTETEEQTKVAAEQILVNLYNKFIPEGI